MSTTPAPRRLEIPEAVLGIARELEAAGFETWCVGGAVRDNLLGQPNNDFDLATAATPGDVQRLFRRTVPIGVAHGTVAVLDRDNGTHEVTTFRRDVSTDGRHAVVQCGVSLDDDLARRDFTINAIAYHPLKHAWRDPFDGARDLAAKVVRAVGDPAQRFREDYLRILRGLRFAARFDFTIEAATLAAAKAEAPGLTHLSAERVRDEWLKGLATAVRAADLVAAWRAVGALESWLPELREGESEKREAWRDGLDRLGNDPVLITSFLSSDPAATLTRLRCSNQEIERGRRIQRHRGTWPDPADGVAVRRWMSAAGAAVDDLVRIAQAAGPAGRLPVAVAAVRASGAPLAMGDLAVTGDDLIASGVPKGPAIGTTLRALLDHVLETPADNVRERLLALARTQS